MSLTLGQRALRASLSAAQHVQLQQRALTRLTGTRERTAPKVMTTLSRSACLCSQSCPRPVPFPKSHNLTGCIPVIFPSA